MRFFDPVQDFRPRIRICFARKFLFKLSDLFDHRIVQNANSLLCFGFKFGFLLPRHRPDYGYLSSIHIDVYLIGMRDWLIAGNSKLGSFRKLLLPLEFIFNDDLK